MAEVKKTDYSSVPSKEHNDVIEYRAPKGFGARHTQALILFCCLISAYTIRSHLSVTMVAMTAATPTCISLPLNNMKNVTAADRNATDNDTKAQEGDDQIPCEIGEDAIWHVYQTYKWSKSEQEMVIFAFFLGYTTMMLPAGMLAQRFGGKKPILVALLVNGIISILTPWLPIMFGWLGVSVCRLLQGLSQAALYPSVHSMLGQWAPLDERARLSSYVYSGSQIGTILAFQVSGFLGGSFLGWPSSFWMSGGLCLVCFALFLWLGAATPHEHPTISAEELMYITGRSANAGVPKRLKTPWKHILTSSAVWAIIFSHMGSSMGFLFVLTQTPRYLSAVLHIDIKHNGVYSSLPYVAMVFSVLFFGWFSDYCNVKGYLSLKNIRKTANTIGMAGTAVFLLWFGYVNNIVAAVVLLIISQGLHTGVQVGCQISQIDLCPNFAGVVYALGNMMANLSALLVPVIVSTIVKDDVGNQVLWKTVFWIICGVMVVANMPYVFFAQSDQQPWNDADKRHDHVIEELKLVLEQREQPYR